jgi:NRAMP (natural resistance-associated macrophage protein)-like metal ion transporter
MFCGTEKLIKQYNGSKKLLKRFVNIVGPGFVTGAADDDPSGVATFSIAGAKFGFMFLWISWLIWPFVAVVQFVCAKIGMVTGKGLAGAMSQTIPRPLMIGICALLFIANFINIGADLAGMADAAELLTGISSHLFVAIFGAIIFFSIIKFRYQQIANTLKWLVLSLFSYVITAFIVDPDWDMIMRTSLSISIPSTQEEIAMLIAILGTSISPYLFFWQASHEVEEGRNVKRKMLINNKIKPIEMKDRILDVSFGTFFANIVMFFIILTTALTLNAHGITEIETSKDVAKALEPLAGELATLLYSVGIISVGFLAIPTLAGSAAYALAETYDWSQGLDSSWLEAKSFYIIIGASIMLGMLIDFSDIDPIKAMFFSAVINGMIAPFMLVAILIIARDETVMGSQAISKMPQFILLITALTMFTASIAMFIAN